jgi:membrane-bound lytic murein transglycosylase D
VERTGYADFWQLYKLNVLPKETRNYVPIILALTLIAKDPARYGIDVQPEEPLQTDTVKPGHPLNLRLVADALDVDVDTLRELNPELLRLTTPADPAFVLRLPVGTAERFSTKMASIPPEKWLTWRQHRVEDGETLASVAQKFHVTAASLVEANSLSDGSARTPSIHAALDSGTKLIIPLGSESQPSLGELVRYRTRRSDSLESVADEFDVSVDELKKWNHLRGDKITPGLRLKIYPGGMTPPPTQTKAAVKTTAASAKPVAAISSASGVRPAAEVVSSATDGAHTQPVIHKVRRGETLYSIARAYMTTVEALRAGNHFLFSRPLQTGDTLTIASR